MRAHSIQLFMTLWTECSPPGSSVHGILQERTLEHWSRLPCPIHGSSRPMDQIHVSCTAGRFFTAEPPRKTQWKPTGKQFGSKYQEPLGNIYTTICKIDSQWEFAVWLRELTPRLCDNLEAGDGREVGGRFKREGTYIYLCWFMLIYGKNQLSI